MKASAAWTLAAGTLFGFGLAVSSMVRPEVVLAFLLGRDMGLPLVLGAAVVVTFAAYRLAPRFMARPLAEKAFLSQPSVMSARTLGGAALFGVGWGLSGVCPGPAMAGVGAGNWPLALALGAMLAGAYVQGRYFGDAR